MQKVVGSSPIIRFTKAPLSGVFCFPVDARRACCKRTLLDVRSLRTCHVVVTVGRPSVRNATGQRLLLSIFA
jgi:hypothetical protein